MRNARASDWCSAVRSLAKVIRTDNGKNFCGKAMVAWAHERDVQLRLTEPGKLNQNTYIESFNGALARRMPQQHWFPSLLQARTLIETSAANTTRRDREKTLGGQTPSAYAKQLTIKADTLNPQL